MIERNDKKRNIDKVIASLAKNPLQTEHQIAADTGIGKSTVNRAKQEMGKNGDFTIKDDRIMHLTDKDFELMQLIQKRKFKRMEDKENPVNDSDINNWDKEAKARYTLFRGDVTDAQGGTKDISALDKLNDLIG